MRVIAGEKKGRKLGSPKGDLIRPTPDKVKGALFNILAEKNSDAIIIDLFAGSGAIGIEALSRGARKVYFGDFDKASFNLVKKNLEHLDYTKEDDDKGEVLYGDYSEVLTEIKEKADIIFLDPPYGKGIYEDVLNSISDNDSLKKDGVIIIERDTWNPIPDEVAKYTKKDTRKYGKTSIDIFEIK